MIKNDSNVEFYKILIKGVDKHSNNQVEFSTEIISSNNSTINEYEFLSSISITGSYNGDLFLFASKESLNQIFQLVYDADFTSLNNANLVQDSMNEFLNLIVANATEEFSKAGVPVDIGVPRIKNDEGISSILSRVESGIILNTPIGAMFLTFINKIK